MKLGEVGTLVHPGTPAVNGGTKVPIFGRVIWAVTVGAVVGEVTPIFVETGMVVVAPKAVGTITSIKGMDVCVFCACEDDCNDCDDIEAPVLTDLVILFKALPLRKCMHKDADFFLGKVLLKIVANLQKDRFHKKRF